jgi:hypothetical protein
VHRSSQAPLVPKLQPPPPGSLRICLQVRKPGRPGTAQPARSKRRAPPQPTLPCLPRFRGGSDRQPGPRRPISVRAGSIVPGPRATRTQYPRRGIIVSRSRGRERCQRSAHPRSGGRSPKPHCGCPNRGRLRALWEAMGTTQRFLTRRDAQARGPRMVGGGQSALKAMCDNTARSGAAPIASSGSVGTPGRPHCEDRDLPRPVSLRINSTSAAR